MPAGFGKKGKSRFDTTSWSLVRAASSRPSPDQQKALAKLCSLYWPAVYAFIRCQGNDPDTAMDLTQGFFTRVLEKEYLSEARRDRGRFRSFLLACVRHYLADERDRARAKKRGGDKPALPLDLETAESFTYRLQPGRSETPERIYERQWASSVVECVLEQLASEAAEPERFAHLKPFLTGDSGDSYGSVAARLGMTPGAVKVAVHRLRRRFGALLRAEVAKTVRDQALVDAEVRFLLRSLW